MPPIYPPFWKPFEKIGRFGILRKRVASGNVVTGPPGGADAFGGDEWKRLATDAALYEAWGPPPASRWSGYHKPTLFAAVESVKPKNLWPRGAAGLEARAGATTPGVLSTPPPAQAPAWADERTAIVLDLPGPVCVAYAAFLFAKSGHIPVSTFHNWPHQSGLVDVEETLGALLYYGPWVVQSRLHVVDPVKAPPVLMLDSDRLGVRPPKPLDFDNRYYMLEADLPAGPTLANAGIEKLVYVRPQWPREAPRHLEMDDVNGWLHDLNERVPVHLAHAALDQWGLDEPVRFAPAIRKTPFNTTKDPAFRGFRRNAAGGFGVLVPEPGSGG